MKVIKINESIDNVERVLDKADEVAVTATMNLVTAAAIEDSRVNSEKADRVQSDLQKEAESVIADKELPLEKNEYTKPVKINEDVETKTQDKLEDINFVMNEYVSKSNGIESVEGEAPKFTVTCNGRKVTVEFDPTWSEYVYTINGEGPEAHTSYEFIASDIWNYVMNNPDTKVESVNEGLGTPEWQAIDGTDDEDDYLDYDMFDFVNGFVSDTWPSPKNPLPNRYKKFEYTGRDTYTADSEGTIDENDFNGQVTTDPNGNVVLYAVDADKFNDIKKICDIYKIKYDEPQAKKSSNSKWNFSMKIHVPKISGDIPMMLEDYLDTIGVTVEDAMPTDFAKKYRDRQAKLEAEKAKYLASKKK